MGKILFVIIIGLLFISIFSFIIQNILAILAFCSFIALLVGFYLMNAIQKLEIKYQIKLVSKKQFKITYSTFFSCLYLAVMYYKSQQYFNPFTGQYVTNISLSEFSYISLSLSPVLIIFIYTFYKTFLKWKLYQGNKKG